MSTVNPLDQLRRRIGSGSAPVAFAALAEEHRRAGRLDEAVAVCRDGLDRYPAYVSARVTLGRALLDLGRVREAVVELEAAVEQSPDNLAAARVLADARKRLATMPAIDLERHGDDRADADAFRAEQEAIDAAAAGAALGDVATDQAADHAGVWSMPLPDHSGTPAVIDEWLMPSAEPTPAADVVASSWDDETIYSPVATESTAADGQDCGVEQAHSSLDRAAADTDAPAHTATSADTDADGGSVVASPTDHWGTVEAAEPCEPAPTTGQDAGSSCAWGDVEVGEKWRAESSVSPWFAQQPTPETAQAASAVEAPTAKDAEFQAVSTEVPAEADVEDSAEVRVRDVPDVMGLSPVSEPDVAPPGDWQEPNSRAGEDQTVEHLDEAVVLSAQPEGPVPTESRGEPPSPWDSLLEAAVDEVFADAASPSARTADPPAGLDHTALASASGSEYDDATVQTLQKLLAAVRARRAELGLLR